MSKQKGLRFYRPLMAYEFGTHLEFLFALWLELPGWMRSLEMDQHSPSPCGPESTYRLPESSNSGGKGAQVVPPKRFCIQAFVPVSASGCMHRHMSLCQHKTTGGLTILRGGKKLLWHAVSTDERWILVGVHPQQFRRLTKLPSVDHAWLPPLLRPEWLYHSFPSIPLRALNSHMEWAAGGNVSPYSIT